MSDLEQERVTALWREAAATLDVPLEDARCLCGHTAYWHSLGGKGDCEAASDCACDWFASSDPQRMLKLDALVRAERAEAECGRLREQLDAARQALETVLAEHDSGYEPTWRAVARAALGVVGEQAEAAVPGSFDDAVKGTEARGRDGAT